MPRWALVLVVSASLGGIYLVRWIAQQRRDQYEEERADLVPRWAAFVNSEPVIPRLGLPAVQPLKAMAMRSVDSKVARFGRRLAK